MTLLGPYASATVSVAAPGRARSGCPRRVAAELAAAVGAALDNVARHCDPGTRAWVLVEDEPDAVTVSVRDDGLRHRRPSGSTQAAGAGPARGGPVDPRPDRRPGRHGADHLRARAGHRGGADRARGAR